MNNTARENIFNRLNTALENKGKKITQPVFPTALCLSRDEKIELLKKNMEAVRSEVHVVKSENWIQELKEISYRKDIKTLLYSPETEIGATLENAWKQETESLPVLTAYEGTIENFKDRLFSIDGSVTTVKGGIAETGALILWPDVKEPRLMSLLPPIHIAVLDAENIYNTFSEAVEHGKWAEQMPSNALLISGPSKTADIELTLAFGVHGPKELIVIIKN